MATVQLTVDVDAIDFKREMLQRKLKRLKTRQLDDFGKLTVKISQRSMRPAPQQFTKSGKRKKLSRYGRYRAVKTGRRAEEARRAGDRTAVRFQRGMHSPPGVPPYFHRGSEISLKNQKYDVYGRATNEPEVVIQTTKKSSPKAGRIAVPILHEAGGVTRPYDGAKTARYPARPYMLPAGMKAIKLLQRKMRNSVR